MTLTGVRIFKVAVVIVPLTLVFAGLHFLGPGLRREHRAGTLPDGYEFVGEYGPYNLYARRDNLPAREAGAILETFRRAVFAEFGKPLNLRMPASRFDVIVFSNRTDLREYTKGQLGSDFARNAGFYLGSWRAMGVVGSRSAATIVRPLFHEGTHMILDTCVPGAGHDWSRWLNEGLATWLEASGIHADGSITCGGVEPGLLASVRTAIARGTWLPLDRLLKAEAADFEGERNLLFYGESNLLVHYLIGGARRSKFFAYLDEERRSGPVPPHLFGEYFGEVRQVEAALLEHIRQIVTR